jgi:hypothetical protein
MSSVSKKETILDFEGSISFETVELLLDKLRSTKEFQDMKKLTRKRLYAIFVESIENIYKYSANNFTEESEQIRVPEVSIKKMADTFYVTAGNMIPNDEIEELRFKLDQINQLDKESLKTLYEDIIHLESGAEDSGAGLGLITIALRTNNDVEYSFTPLDDEYSFFEIQITISE